MYIYVYDAPMQYLLKKAEGGKKEGDTKEEKEGGGKGKGKEEEQDDVEEEARTSTYRLQPCMHGTM
jgi:hypothetical protein